MGAELKPEFVKRIKKIEKGKFHRYSNIEALRREIENVRKGGNKL